MNLKWLQNLVISRSSLAARRERDYAEIERKKKMATFGDPNHYRAQAQLQQAQLAQAQNIAAQGYQKTYGNATTTAGPLAGVVYGGAVNTVPPQSHVYWPATNQVVGLPNPTGHLVAIWLTDMASGCRLSLHVDSAYAPILAEIERLSYSARGFHAAPQPKPVMVDDEFSMDEMERAEKMIEDMHAGA